MKKQTTQRWQSSLLATIATFIVLCGMTTATRAQDDDNYPKPDFTELEKWYEVVKFEYNSLGATATIAVKAKTHQRPNAWYIRWFDADGVKVAESRFNFHMAEVGEPYREKTLYGPTETEMETKVKSVKLIRIKD